ncbi:uncharacterized protein [Rutidosis leptorrhynchoides]|uniref:uncharacterized protein n=1 Tax=Rutidosis leptorrhynchoides TaxID=125765 RepID=UPI003A99202E
MIDEYCPRNEIQRLETELWNLKLQGMDISGYTNRFLELAFMCPTMVTPEYKRVERCIWGLSEDIQGNVMSSKLETIQSAIRMAHDLMAQVVRRQPINAKTDVKVTTEKRKWDGNQEGHFKKECPKAKKGETAKGRAFQITTKEAREDPELVTGMFLLNNHLASILFDTGADKTFIAKDFSVTINRPLTALDTRYAVELANGKLIKVDKIMRGCVLNLSNNLFEVDLMLIELGSFDVVIGMDWLSKNRADIKCAEKSIRIPLENGENLVIQGDKSKVNLNIISYMRAQRYLKKGYPSILGHVKGLKTKEIGLEDVPVVREFPQVFP